MDGRSCQSYWMCDDVDETMERPLPRLIGDKPNAVSKPQARPWRGGVAGDGPFADHAINLCAVARFEESEGAREIAAGLQGPSVMVLLDRRSGLRSA